MQLRPKWISDPDQERRDSPRHTKIQSSTVSQKGDVDGIFRQAETPIIGGRLSPRCVSRHWSVKRGKSWKIKITVQICRLATIASLHR
ncbi:hypothetical protein TNCV_1676421 [Trichonephila clavipes]|nr:hypothetical protein TNCV_1676421 [Trichonephila clavipes]